MRTTYHHIRIIWSNLVWPWRTHRRLDWHGAWLRMWDGREILRAINEVMQDVPTNGSPSA